MFACRRFAVSDTPVSCTDFVARRPLLKGRLRLNRIEHRLGDVMHADWLHTTRRACRGILPNCKLATVEREILKIVRDDDLPGSQAPAAWLAFLRGHSSYNLARVLDHNRQDGITLMQLADHLFRSGALHDDQGALRSK